MKHECGKPVLTDGHLDTLLSPTILSEVLSPSTEAFDRAEKWVHYQQIPSLQEYLLIAQDAARVDHYRRQDDSSWRYAVTIGLDAAVGLPTVGCTLALAEVYANVTFA